MDRKMYAMFSVNDWLIFPTAAAAKSIPGSK
jgi:hypothetical protein